jgi:DNA-binding CsgD family transcriptional regulator
MPIEVLPNSLERTHLVQITFLQLAMINWDFTEKLFSSKRVSDVFTLVKDWGVHHGLEEFGFATKFLRNTQGSDAGGVFTFTTYSSEWSTSYSILKQSKLADRDARVQCSLRGVPAGAWDKDGKTSYKPMLEKLIPGVDLQLKTAGNFGLEAGIVVPLQSRHAEWGFFGFSRYQKISIPELELSVAEVAHTAQAANVALERLFFHENAIQKLSFRECDALRWASIGKTSWEISVILKISERTVNFHLSEAARKLGVKGRRAACTAAMVQGLIQFA